MKPYAKAFDGVNGRLIHLQVNAGTLTLSLADAEEACLALQIATERARDAYPLGEERAAAAKALTFAKRYGSMTYGKSPSDLLKELGL